MIDQKCIDNDDDNNDDDDNSNDKKETLVIYEQINGQNNCWYEKNFPKSTIIHFLMIEDIIIEAFDLNDKKFHDLNKNLADQFIRW